MDFYPSLYCFVNASLYVVSLYLVPRRVRQLSRDNIENVSGLKVKYRMLTASMATILSICLSWFVLNHSPLPIRLFYKGQNSLFSLLGFRLDNIFQIICRTTFLMGIFYLGPLIANILLASKCIYFEVNYYGKLSLKADPSLINSAKSYLISLSSEYNFDIILFRNLVFAPITEEIVFRSVMLPILFLSVDVASHWQIVIVAAYSPIWFGLAHAHHLLDRINSGAVISQAILVTLVQLTYTSIFGFLSAMLFFRTGSIYSCIISHMICNYIGLPDIGFMYAPNSLNRSCSQLSCLYQYRYLILFLHGFGLVLFTCYFYVLTSDLAKESIYYAALNSNTI
eukprot:gene7745-10522_t